jgi:uncharacterized protein YdiU (UPF0061 family)
LRAELGEGVAVAACLGRWQARLAREWTSPESRSAAMRRANPALIPRNHRVESALDGAVGGDLQPLDALLAALADPWCERPRDDPYRRPPAPHEAVRQTFCGT